jgi:cathepsin L
MNGKNIAVLIAIISAATVLLTQYENKPIVSEFEAWKAQFGMKFESKFEEIYRERVFLENLAKIANHNINEHRTYELGLNQFSALTQE